MSGFLFSHAALQDLDDILEYVLNEAGPGTAQKVYDDIFQAIHKLVEHPHIGHTREELRDTSLRVWIVHSYLIVYRPDDSPLGISRVLHGSRDLTRQPTPHPF